MDKNLSVFTKGLILAAVPLLAQLLFIALLVKMQSTYAEAQRWALHSKEVIADTEAVYRRLADAHSSLRAFVVTGNSTFTQPYEEARRRVPQEFADLQVLVAHDPKQQARVGRMAAQAEELLALLAEEDRLVRVGAREEAVAQIIKLSSKDRIEAVRHTIDEFLREEERLDAEHDAALDRAARQQNWVLAAGGALAVMSTVVLALLLGHGITRRLAILRDNARRLAEGQGLAAPLAGTDEIAEVDRAFHTMADSLAQKNQENEMFVYSVSHDLRSPLVNLQGFSEELGLACRDLRAVLGGRDVPEAVRQRGLTLLDGNVAESIHFIQTSVSRLGRIIDALLRLSRAGRVEYQWQMVDVGAAIHRIVEALRVSIAQRHAEVTIHPLPPVWGDPTAVEQIFANLIGNAVQYLDPGRPGKIEVGCREPADGAQASGLRTFYVQDNGLGIPEAYHKKIFTAFQRLHADVSQGEGIGLALVRRMVERHGGRISVESEARVGSTFLVTLPVQSPNALRRAESGPAVPAERRQVTS